ncbi:MAG TPA: twin-arginine translocase TatA/TatE family subunit [Candidatus Dormibacteraeota bacterium]|nr:twin-arginine translocase TatA/TatE family subunit [Candidatus Dormibacteraeota bacterium]HXL78005.1 twin-arginine translocase TatA/TatE family subunit [Candidatus Eisenbacteria bacterium]
MPIHPFWIIAIIVVVLIVFGPGRLPELGGAVGKAMREFRKATSELTSEVTHSTQPAPAPPVAATPPAPPPAPTESAPAQGSESASPSNR